MSEVIVETGRIIDGEWTVENTYPISVSVEETKSVLTAPQRKAALAAKIKALREEAESIEDLRAKRTLTKVATLLGMAEELLRTHRKS